MGEWPAFNPLISSKHPVKQAVRWWRPLFKRIARALMLRSGRTTLGFVIGGRDEKNFFRVTIGFFWLVAGAAFAQEPWREIRATPNPCIIEPGRDQCTAYITWRTGGVDKAKVFVTSRGRTEQKNWSSVAPSCESDRCRAPWITANATYLRTLRFHSKRSWSLATDSCYRAFDTPIGVRSRAEATESRP